MSQSAGLVVLSDLIIYPLKSAAGIHVTHMDVNEVGPRYDRRWMLIDGNGAFLTQRQLPRLALITPQLSSTELRFRAPGQPPLTLPLESPRQVGLEVTIWNDRCDARWLSDEADAWFSRFLGTACRLVFLPDDAARQVDLTYARVGDRVGFADGFPFLLTSEASLADLNARANQTLRMNRFRPNLVVRGCDAYAEDSWRGVQIGSLTFRVVKPCARCSITTVEQETAHTGKEPLKTLASYRTVGGKVMFGQNLIHNAGGRLERGAPLVVLNE